MIILDLLMPELDGFAFIAAFRQLPACRDVPIVIWTAQDLTSEQEAALRRSASAVLTKGSTSATALIDRLRPFLARGTAQRG